MKRECINKGKSKGKHYCYYLFGMKRAKGMRKWWVSSTYEQKSIVQHNFFTSILFELTKSSTITALLPKSILSELQTLFWETSLEVRELLKHYYER